METLDLHGTKHQQAEERVRMFLNFTQLPCQIITGNSEQMKRIVKHVVEEYEWFCQEKDSYNYGTLVVMEKKI